jgi:hypothetical protein
MRKERPNSSLQQRKRAADMNKTNRLEIQRMTELGKDLHAPIPPEFILSVERALTGRPCLRLSCREPSKRTVQLNAQPSRMAQKYFYIDPYGHDILPYL